MHMNNDEKYMTKRWKVLVISNGVGAILALLGFGWWAVAIAIGIGLILEHARKNYYF